MLLYIQTFMRLLLKISTTLLFIISLNSCDLGPDKTVTFSGTVFDGDIYFPLEGVSVKLDDKVSTTNSAGLFTFSSVLEGEHDISIILPTYKPYNKRIVIPSEQNLEIKLTGTQINDCFPLKLRLKRKYKYYEVGGSTDYWIYSDGYSYWEINDIVIKTDTTIYNISETKIYTIGNNSFSRIDTTFDDFKIYEDKSHRISIPHLIEDTKFSRYMNSYLGDQYEYNLTSGSYIIKKDIGLYFLYKKITDKNYKKYEFIE